MRTILVWPLRVVVFLALFALAMNNQHEVELHWFFGIEWQTRMIYVVLAAFMAGCAVGVLAMAPRWWRGRRTMQPPAAAAATATPAAPSSPRFPEPPSSQFGAEAAMPPRENL
jgi:uncharacterized integral membrane protein